MRWLCYTKLCYLAFIEDAFNSAILTGTAAMDGCWWRKHREIICSDPIRDFYPKHLGMPTNLGLESIKSFVDLKKEI